MKSAFGARWPRAMYTSPPQVDDDDDDVDVCEDGDGDDDEDDGDDDDNDVYHVCDMMASCYLHVSTYILVVDYSY